MDPVRTVEATLEIEIETQAPKGALIGAGGERHPFSGWIGFASAVEDLRRARRSSGQSSEEEAS
jgi:hypothetical protein